MSRPRSLFVTGTDTGVGKTTVACALIAAFRRAGRRITVLKPVETGCAADPQEGLIPADARRLAAAAGLEDVPDARLCPNCYGLPTAPELAARATGRPVDVSAILGIRNELAGAADLLLMEGAGGLLVPVARDLDIAGLAALLGAPLLIVGRSSLGTINHTRLTVEAARLRGLRIAGVILNRIVPNLGPEEAGNAEAITRYAHVPVFGTLPHAPEAQTPQLAELAERHLDLEGLWQAL